MYIQLYCILNIKIFFNFFLCFTSIYNIFSHHIFIREFIQDVDSTLKEYRVVPILDPFGPSTEDNSLQLIIGSQETSKGCLKVNEVRKEKGLSQLDIHVIGKLL